MKATQVTVASGGTTSTSQLGHSAAILQLLSFEFIISKYTEYLLLLSYIHHRPSGALLFRLGSSGT